MMKVLDVRRIKIHANKTAKSVSESAYCVRVASGCRIKERAPEQLGNNVRRDLRLRGDAAQPLGG